MNQTSVSFVEPEATLALRVTNTLLHQELVCGALDCQLFVHREVARHCLALVSGLDFGRRLGHHWRSLMSAIINNLCSNIKLIFGGEKVDTVTLTFIFLP